MIYTIIATLILVVYFRAQSAMAIGVSEWRTCKLQSWAPDGTLQVTLNLTTSSSLCLTIFEQFSQILSKKKIQNEYSWYKSLWFVKLLKRHRHEQFMSWCRDWSSTKIMARLIVQGAPDVLNTDIWKGSLHAPQYTTDNDQFHKKRQ